MAEKIKYVGNAVRNEKIKKNFKRSLSLALALALIIIAALVGLRIAEKTAVDALENEKDTGGYPVSFSTNDIRDVKVMGNNLLVLTKKFVTALDKSGDILWEHSFTYGDSAVFTGERYAVVFDRLSNKYTVIDKDGKAQERKSDISGQIFNAKVTDKGEVMLALKSDSSSSLVALIDKKGEDKLIWSCTQEYALDLALSDDGKTLFCGSIGASGGEMYTKVYALRVKDGEEKSYTVPSSSCISINTISSDKFNVLTTDGLYIFDSSKDDMLINSVPLNSKLVYWASDSDGNIAVLTDSTGNISENTLRVFDKKAEEKYSLSLEDSIEDIFVNGEEVLLLYGDCVIGIKNGEIDRKLFFGNKAVGVVKAHRQVYCYSMGGVEKAKAK